MSYFEHLPAIRYEGPQSDNPLAYRHYDRNKLVLGKRMEEHLRLAVCYWHTFVWPGVDMFGQGTFKRPWQQAGDAMERAQLKADAAFEFFSKLGTPYYTFHDTDVAPEGDEHRRNTVNNFMGDHRLSGAQAGGHAASSCCGARPICSRIRVMRRAPRPVPNPEVFAFAATQVCQALEATQRLGGENYVLWGGREGYDTLLNTDLKREREQLARFLRMVVEHEHKIGFKGALLIEPKPQEPTKHQYDYDVATVHGFLLQYGLQKEIRVNIEANHATLAGHSFHHEIATAYRAGHFRQRRRESRRSAKRLGYRPVPEQRRRTDARVLRNSRHGGFTTGGMNFDAKVRRQSVDPEDLFYGHIGAIDVSRSPRTRGGADRKRSARAVQASALRGLGQRSSAARFSRAITRCEALAADALAREI